MQPTHFVLFHVASPEASARFYERLLGHAPLESSHTFAMFALNEQTMLGLWSRDTVQPATSGQPGASELALVVAGEEDVEQAHARWRALDLKIVQPPTRMDFGTTCTALDPDGHRLRVFAPA
jgi:catechol 2,3-dioxygenase-like lactoylglutathione lyase family enzyme